MKIQLKNFLLCIVLLILCVLVGCAQKSKEVSKGVKKDDIVHFGSYNDFGESRYNNTYKNGDQIEWYVLDNDSKNNKILLLSKYVLYNSRQMYHQSLDFSTNKYHSWTNSKLREWLNNEFYETCFNNNEKNKILETPIVDHLDNQVDDKVFLLSRTEMEQYITNKKVVETVGRRIDKDRSPASYWTRQEEKGKYICANSAGLNDFFEVGWLDYCGVRPAIWVKY
ncbi:MAG: hypothetical protein J6M39_03040 [Lachnospiraceae bacterium]|nr:hypothetical protein [Lachnospiraceae bacterium]